MKVTSFNVGGLKKTSQDVLISLKKAHEIPHKYSSSSLKVNKVDQV